MPTPTVTPSSGVKYPMKLFSGETVVNVALSCASRPWLSLACTSSSYWVARSSWMSGCQLVPSSDIAPVISVPLSTAVMTTSSRAPSSTVTSTSSFIPTLSAASSGVMDITAVEVSASSAARSASVCSVPPPPPPSFSEESSPPPLQADKVSTPQSSAAAALRPLRRMPSLIR